MVRRSVLFVAFVVMACGVVKAVSVSAQDQGARPVLPLLAKPPIPKEPGWSHPAYRGWELLGIPGLIGTYYDISLKGTLDYMVIRKILRKTSAEEITVEEAIETAKRDNLSVYISSPVVYFTSKYPLFYCVGLDDHRNCREMWVDISEDGLNGNEVLYTMSSATPDVR